MYYKINTIYKNDFTDFFKNIKEHFFNNENSIHKARNEIKIIEHENKELVIKSFKIPHHLNKIIYSFFRASKAKRSYDHSIKILDFVPAPIGYIEFKKFGLLYESYFISENFKYDYTMKEVLFEKSKEEKEEILKEFASFTYELHQNNVLHLDYSPGNILIKKEVDETYTFKAVDLNRMKFKTLNDNERLHNFSKLWAKDEDLETIVKYYAKLTGKDEKESIEKALYFTQKDKEMKKLKNRLKGK